MKVGAAVTAAAVIFAAAGCAGHQATRDGPGGVAYQWPPPASVAAGPATPARFCALLIDDLEHIKATQQASHGGGLASTAPEYLDLIPGLEAAAPPTIARSAKSYFDQVAGLLAMLSRYHYDYFAIPEPELRALNRPGGSAAASAVSGFAIGQCHYDINAVPATP